MEENVVGEGEGDCIRDDLTPVAKKSGVELIESGPSRLDNTAENYKADECEHFSIRGYVAEVRRKDMKICWPFPTVGDHNKLEEQMLPPLHVPQFRWWQCQNCLRKTDAKDTPIETGVVKSCCNRVYETKTSTSPGILSTLSCGDAQKLNSSFQESSEVNIVDARKSSSDVSLPVNNDKHWPALFGNKKEKGAEVVDPIMEGENMNLAVCRSASLKKVDTCLAGVNFTKGGTFNTYFPIGKKGGDLSSSGTAIATPFKSKGNELVTSPNEIFQKEAETLKSKGDEYVNRSKEIFQTEKPEFSRTNLSQTNVGDRDGVTSSVISEVDEASNAVMCQTRKLHSLVSIDSSSEDENLAGEDFQDQHHVSRRGNSGGTSRGSKPRKVCSLTDIIRREMLATSSELHYTERDTKTDHKKTEVSQSKATPEASPGMSVYPITNNQVAFQGTDKKVMLGKKKKCKLSRDKDEGSSRMSWQRGATENINILKEDSETISMDAINANGELTGDASFLPDLYLGSKISLGKHGNDKKLILDREKKEMSQVEGSLSSLAHHQDGISSKVEIRKDAEIKCAGSELIPIKCFDEAVAGTDLNPGAQIYVAAQQKTKNLALDEKKNKVPQVEGEKSSVMLGREGMSRKDLILKRYLDRKHKVAPSDSLNSVRDPFTGRGVHRGLKRHMQTHRKATLYKRQKNLPQVIECRATVPGSESVSSPLICQPKDSSNACNYENAADVKEPSKLSMDQCENMANKMCEWEASDDIPMEIVELMARNQYERHHDYAKEATENRSCLPETTEKDKDTELMDCTEAFGNEMLRLPHKKSNLQTSLSSNAKNDIDLGPSGGLTKQNSDACLSTVDGEYCSINFSRSQLEQAQASSGFKEFPERQGKIPSQVSYPVIGSRRRCGTENCSWDGDIVGQSCLSSSVQSLGAYHNSQAILQQHSIVESQSVWSTVPSRMPFESNSPHKFVTEVSISNRLSQSPGPLPEGNVNLDHTLKSLNLKASHLQKKKGSSEMETYREAHSEHLFACTDEGNDYHPKMRGSLDLYNNETLPAMHLLRLMHAGVCSSTPVNMNKNRESFLKDPPYAHDQIINKLPGPEASVSKSNGALGNLSSCDYHSRSHHLGKSCEHFPPVSIAKAVDSLAQRDVSFGRATVFTHGLGKSSEHFPPVSIAKAVDSLAQNDVSFERATVFTNGLLGKALPGALKYQDRGDEKRSYSTARTQGPKLHMSASRNSRTNENHEYMIHNPQKECLLLPASDSRQFPERSQTAGGLTKHVELKVDRKHETVSSVERIGGILSCTLNRNPADFTVPENANIYMIGAGHLKRKLINIDLNKRPKKMKHL
ncbi:uncharacterized protein LOC122655941 isoform X2 [Telopea speciosissima]|uniref:uncharacterized protein LOC122655941 isoform X2 n=1 Tax=Telopea speciosissima TaxID=54955 RepID=UPI001CC71D4A|nr:uncharacterized protein LOC122655941 isoform X2 [Telopea speciosissima]